MPLIPIHAATDPRIAEYVGVREAELRKDRFDAPGGLFVAEGELVVRRLIASRYRTRSLLCTHARLKTIPDVLASIGPDVPVYAVDQATMNGIVGFNIHRGVLAIGQRGHEPLLESILQGIRCAIVLEDLVNHDNLGSLFRNAAALAGGCFGQACILLSPKCADPLYRKSIRVSMGAALLVPFARLSDWPGDLHRLGEFGFRTLAMTPARDASDLAAVESDLRRSPQRIAVVLGSEGPGLTDAASQACALRVRIDMPGRRFVTQSSANRSAPGPEEPGEFGNSQGIDSLNVAVAGAIALHRLYSVTPAENCHPKDGPVQ